MKNRITIFAFLAVLLLAFVGTWNWGESAKAPAPRSSAVRPPASAPAPATVDLPPRDPMTATPRSSEDMLRTPSRCAARPLFAFPWPNPPTPSDSAFIPRYLLWPYGSDDKTLMDVARRLESSIAAAGYLDPKYLGAGCNGFAVILDLEQIDPDGARKPGTAAVAPSSGEAAFSLLDYVKRLFYAPPGYYRQIVLVVSDEAIAATTPAPTPEELRSIAKVGSSAAPPGYDGLAFSWKYNIVALVYEFEKGVADGDARLIPPAGRLRASQHLKKAQLY